ncbi:MAG: hypothetical protein JOZ81_34080 [Chloroflexi bacterium]|nr:hypothetical protein [Chloroflexota bacterium]
MLVGRGVAVGGMGVGDGATVGVAGGGAEVGGGLAGTGVAVAGGGVGFLSSACTLWACALGRLKAELITHTARAVEKSAARRKR